jgi:hypothetical protein
MRIPREITLLGKGPSLDDYKYEMYTVGINEVAYLKKCDAAIAIDYPVLKKYQEHITDMLVYRKHTHLSYEFKNMFLVDYNIHAPVKELRTGTASIFIQLAGFLGVRTIHFWGFDAITGVDGYANSVVENKAEGTNKNKYKKICYNIVAALKKTNIQPIWRHI